MLDLCPWWLIFCNQQSEEAERILDIYIFFIIIIIFIFASDDLDLVS